MVARTRLPDILHTNDLESLATRGLQFGTIYADPPWLYDDQNSRGATSDHFCGMSTKGNRGNAGGCARGRERAPSPLDYDSCSDGAECWVIA